MAWLGAGAITLGIGAALTSGTAVAGASTGESEATSSSTGTTHEASESDGPTATATSRKRTTAVAKQPHSEDASPQPKKKTRHQTEDKDATDSSADSTAKAATTRKGAVASRTTTATKPAADTTAPAVQSAASGSTAAPKVATLPAAKTTARPASATPANPLVALNQAIQSFVHHIQTQYLNTPPKITGYTVPVENADGTYSGHVTVVDKDGDPLTYSVWQPADGGIATIDQSGNYTLTPSEYALSRPGSAELYVQVVESNAFDHYHGFNQIFGKLVEPVLIKALGPNGWPPYSAPSYATVQLVVPSVPWGNTDPSPAGTTSTLATAKVAGLTASAANPLTAAIAGVQAWIKKTFYNTAPTVTMLPPTKNADGTYTGQFTASDVDGDPLTIQFTASMIYGTTSVVDHGDGTYTYTYAPSELALTEPNLTYHLFFTAVESNAAAHFHGPVQIQEFIVDATLGNLLRALIYDPFNELPRYSPFTRARGSASVPIAVGPVTPI